MLFCFQYFLFPLITKFCSLFNIFHYTSHHQILFFLFFNVNFFFLLNFSLDWLWATFSRRSIYTSRFHFVFFFSRVSGYWPLLTSVNPSRTVPFSSHSCFLASFSMSNCVSFIAVFVIRFLFYAICFLCCVYVFYISSHSFMISAPCSLSFWLIFFFLFFYLLLELDVLYCLAECFNYSRLPPFLFLQSPRLLSCLFLFVSLWLCPWLRGLGWVFGCWGMPN